MSISFFQFEIWTVDLNPKKGHTQAWVRPCVIIQSDIFNKNSFETLVVVPLTSNILKKIFPCEFIIEPSNINWLSNKSRYLWTQTITIDKKYLYKKLWTLENKYKTNILNSIKILFNID